MNTIELHGLTKRYGDVLAVDGLDLSVTAGEIVALLGPNGAGKTTTIDMLLGLVPATSGTATLFEGPPAAAVRAGRVGAMPQTGGLLRTLSVLETLQWIAAIRGATSRIDEVLRSANLTEIAKRKVGKCSGGEQQRIKFALALLADPELLVLDEPTAGMDAGARRQFWETMRHEADRGRTILFCTHYLEEAQDFAQRIVVVGRGKLLADGPVAEVRSLASGRTVEADHPHVDDELLARLRTLPGVRSVEANGNRLTIHTSSSDDLLRYLLDDGATGLLVSAPTLESAFLNITEESR
ncbi:ABC transporter ATP-binding protein [Tessaracoccus sp. OH4464_COT-324]|uniref:ABC transporter ATP-binding protein n=1 Tax=Tessaracoccus sp. OH4464_COT-324 TaxID=2491059 RepID=UPI000F62EF18|nr:ABC transporter ATP-binding protein [Tessaracoccus sp. OH4464_COT-324]RRD45279.1 ABC transporter ATP-binding protein [Tessaracoccus sp. OH4464_COT-324]